MQYTATGARLEEDDRETLTMSFWSDLLARSNLCEVAPDFLINEGTVTLIGEWRPSGAFVRDACWVTLPDSSSAEPIRVEMSNCWARNNIFSYACKLAGADKLEVEFRSFSAIIGCATVSHSVGQVTRADVSLHKAVGGTLFTDGFADSYLHIERQPVYSSYSGPEAPPLRDYDVWNVIHPSEWTTHMKVRVCQ